MHYVCALQNVWASKRIGLQKFHRGAFNSSSCCVPQRKSSANCNIEFFSWCIDFGRCRNRFPDALILEDVETTFPRFLIDFTNRNASRAKVYSFITNWSLWPTCVRELVLLRQTVCSACWAYHFFSTSRSCWEIFMLLCFVVSLAHLCSSGDVCIAFSFHLLKSRIWI